ncbi:hypothetical protein V6N13_049286 [Hibiscus sabdariffa]
MRSNLLTNVERKRRHLAIDDLCTICHAGSEDVNHVLRECLLARAVWMKLVKPEWLDEFHSLPFRDWLVSNLKDSNSKRYLQELSVARSSSLLRMGPVVATQSAIARWQLLSLGWVRLNVNGAVSLTAGAAAVEGVIRSDRGEWLYRFARSLGKCSVFSAELWGIFLGMKHAWNRRYRKVKIESDSLDAIQCIKRIDSRRVDSALIIVIREMLGREWEIELAYVPRGV